MYPAFPSSSVLGMRPSAALTPTYHKNGKVAEVVAAAEHLGRRGLLRVTALRAPGPPAVLAGFLLPEDTVHRVAFLRGDAGVKLGASKGCRGGPWVKVWKLEA